jgi:hypothetical protein
MNASGYCHGQPLRWHALRQNGCIVVTCMVVLADQTIVKTARVPVSEWRRVRWQHRRFRVLVMHLEAMVKTHCWRVQR